MLLECGIADSYGVGFEFNDAAYISQKNDLSSYIVHHGHPGLLPGMYSDDTQMSIALAELVLEEQEWTKLKIANKFVECFKRDERKGYSGHFYKFLRIVTNGQEFLDNIDPTSEKCGAAMRTAVIGLYHDLKEVKEKTIMQASLTHNTPNGINSALVISYMSHYFAHGGVKKNLIDFLESNLGDVWTHPWGGWEGLVGTKGVECVRAAITAILAHNKLSEILKTSVSFEGDVDTVSAIAISCASECLEIEKDLPKSLFDTLENKLFGRDYLIELDRKLKLKFK